ncbi:MAG: hypothetical protein PHE29_13690 [Tissierellia bacterium]|nr:hypothetical protein [Tissierellia bacterium]
MLKENTSIRLKTIMKERNLRQVDILEKAKPLCIKYKVKLNKSDLSQYVSGLVVPGQDKLAILGQVLNVNEAWLMGYDVPMDRDYVYKPEYSISTPETTDLLKFFNRLNYQTKREATKRVEELTYIEEYRNTAMIKEDDYQDFIFDVGFFMDNLYYFLGSLNDGIKNNTLDMSKLNHESEYVYNKIQGFFPKINKLVLNKNRFEQEYKKNERKIDITINNADYLKAAHLEGDLTDKQKKFIDEF